MKSFTQWVVAPVAMILLAGAARADNDSIASGTVKSILAEKKEFVLTDSAGKDYTINFGDHLVINRGGKDSAIDLKVGDAVDVCHTKGVLTWKAQYILVKEGSTKNAELVRGAVKGYDSDKKMLTFTDEHGKDWNFPMGDAKVKLNNKDGKIQDVKIGDNALAIVEKTGDKSTLKCLMVEEK
jgi:Cu/Ag efflux protein CusF